MLKFSQVTVNPYQNCEGNPLVIYPQALMPSSHFSSKPQATENDYVEHNSTTPYPPRLSNP